MSGVNPDLQKSGNHDRTKLTHDQEAGSRAPPPQQQAGPPVGGPGV